MTGCQYPVTCAGLRYYEDQQRHFKLIANQIEPSHLNYTTKCEQRSDEMHVL